MQLRKELHCGTIAQGSFAIGTHMVRTLFSARDRLGRGAYWLAVLPMVFALIGFFEGGVAGYFSLDELRLVFFPLIALTTFFAGRRSRDLVAEVPPEPGGYSTLSSRLLTEVIFLNGQAQEALRRSVRSKLQPNIGTGGKR